MIKHFFDNLFIFSHLEKFLWTPESMNSFAKSDLGQKSNLLKIKEIRIEAKFFIFFSQ